MLKSAMIRTTTVGSRHALNILPSSIDNINIIHNCAAFARFFNSDGLKNNKKLEDQQCPSKNAVKQSDTAGENAENVKLNQSTASITDPDIKLKEEEEFQDHWSSACWTKLGNTDKLIKTGVPKQNNIRKLKLRSSELKTQNIEKAHMAPTENVTKTKPSKNAIDTECFYMFNSTILWEWKPLQMVKTEITKSKNESSSILKIKPHIPKKGDINSNKSEINKTAEPVVLGTSNVIKDITLYPISGKHPNSDTPVELDFLQDTLQNPAKYPSVTRILNETMTPSARNVLEKWKESMIEKLGVSGFEQYQAELLEDGKNLHACIQNRLTDKEVLVDPKIGPAYNSLNNIFENVHDIVAVETAVFHPQLKYKGIVDCIASYRGEQCVIDWKKSTKSKFTLSSAYDAPTQLAAYIGAVCATDKYLTTRIEKGLIIYAYTDGTPATVLTLHDFNLEKYWKIWLSKLKQYHGSPERKYNSTKEQPQATKPAS